MGFRNWNFYITLKKYMYEDRGARRSEKGGEGRGWGVVAGWVVQISRFANREGEILARKERSEGETNVVERLPASASPMPLRS